jgi:hypothetical protein
VRFVARNCRKDFDRDSRTRHARLAALSNADARLRAAYLNVPGGASLGYESREPTVIAAIHDWFAAQRADHAAHAHMHEEMRH